MTPRSCLYAGKPTGEIFSRQLVLRWGSYWKIYSPYSTNKYSLKYRYIVQSYKGRTQSLVAKKTDISENRASRNFDLMIIKWCLLKITLQAPFINVQMTFDRNRSSLGLHGNDVCSHQFRPQFIIK
ncbi:hypothetical protein Tco_1293186 [Tanacetum coccineum]